jgi:hypothetical protein
MNKYQNEYDKFLVTDDLRKRFSQFQTVGKDIANEMQPILIETVVIDEAPPFTDSMEVRNAQLA